MGIRVPTSRMKISRALAEEGRQREVRFFGDDNNARPVPGTEREYASLISPGCPVAAHTLA